MQQHIAVQAESKTYHHFSWVSQWSYATTGARGPRRPTAMAQAVKTKYAKRYGPYLGMGYSFVPLVRPGHIRGLEPDACESSASSPLLCLDETSMVLGVTAA